MNLVSIKMAKTFLFFALLSFLTKVLAYSEFGKSCVKAHNGFRRRHGSQSLVWSENLAADAQAWCDELALKDELSYDTKALEEKQQGEILAAVKLMRQKQELPEAPPIEDCFPIVRSWYRQSLYYNYKTGTSKSPDAKIKDFAQVNGGRMFTGLRSSEVVWNSTSEIGVGVARSSQHGDMICSRYYPAGAIGGPDMFKSNIFPPVPALNQPAVIAGTQNADDEECEYEIVIVGGMGMNSSVTETTACPNGTDSGGGGRAAAGEAGGGTTAGGTVSMSCGINKESKIIGGEVAAPGEFPWQVGLRDYSKSLGSSDFYCGGSLVNKQWIVTAAHCLEKPKFGYKMQVVLGEFDKANTDGNEVVVDAELRVIHPNYTGEQGQAGLPSLDYDIGLVKLSQPITSFNDFLRPICLPDITKLNTIDPSKCLASDFEIVETGQLSRMLRKTQAPLHPWNQCKNAWRESFTKRMICAGKGLLISKVYMGDSGGPLACKTKGKYYLIGAVSFGRLLNQQPLPTVYADITVLRPWIDSVIDGSYQLNPAFPVFK